jgi:hypothetical protein
VLHKSHHFSGGEGDRRWAWTVELSERPGQPRTLRQLHVGGRPSASLWWPSLSASPLERPMNVKHLSWVKLTVGCRFTVKKYLDGASCMAAWDRRSESEELA